MVSDFANFEVLEKYDTFYEPKGHFFRKKSSEFVGSRLEGEVDSGDDDKISKEYIK